MNDELLLENKSIDLKILFDFLKDMHNSNIKLDDEAMNTLKQMTFKDGQELINFCFKTGWNEAVGVLLNALIIKEENNK